MIAHKIYEGNRPSFSLLFEELSPYACGQLLAIYEHMVATSGFLYNANSFDTFGVELGKDFALKVWSTLAN